MQKWFALPNFNSFYEVSQNMSIFKLVKYTMIISSDPTFKEGHAQAVGLIPILITPTGHATP